MLKCPCPEAFVSTYRNHFRPFTADRHAHRVAHIEQVDEALISHHFRNNLQVSGVQVKSKVWPKTAIGVEEYNDFLKRLECCKKELFRYYFRCPDVNVETIEQMLQDLEKTVYQLSYSPNVFETRKESLRCAKMANQPSNMKYYETTYRIYYNRIQEVERFKHVLRGLIRTDEKAELKAELRNLHKPVKTTYYMDIGIPALEKLKASTMDPGYIDRYTYRKI